jgi:hypothetical protein
VTEGDGAADQSFRRTVRLDKPRNEVRRTAGKSGRWTV